MSAAPAPIYEFEREYEPGNPTKWVLIFRGSLEDWCLWVKAGGRRAGFSYHRLCEGGKVEVLEEE